VQEGNSLNIRIDFSHRLQSLQGSLSQKDFGLRTPFWLRKITTDHHSLAEVNSVQVMDIQN
jgi:hypothetical protein